MCVGPVGGLAFAISMFVVQAWRNARSSRGLYGLGGGGVVITGALKVGMGGGELRRQIARISGDDICAQLSCGSEAAALWAGIARLAAPVMAGTGLGRLGGSDSQPIVQNTSPTTAARLTFKRPSISPQPSPPNGREVLV
jgi:hypothetical protein